MNEEDSKPREFLPGFVVANVTKITGRGTAVLFEGDPPPILPLGQRAVRVLLPTGEARQTACFVEAARKVPPGEVLAMLFSEWSPEDIPVGSVVTILRSK